MGFPSERVFGPLRQRGQIIICFRSRPVPPSVSRCCTQASGSGERASSFPSPGRLWADGARRCPRRRRSGFLSFGAEAHESENSGRCRWNDRPSRPERMSICMPHFSGLIRQMGSEAPDQNALVMVISTLEPTILTLTSSARLATMDFSSSSQSSLAPSRLSMLFSSSFL